MPLLLPAALSQLCPCHPAQGSMGHTRSACRAARSCSTTPPAARPGRRAGRSLRPGGRVDDSRQPCRWRQTPELVLGCTRPGAGWARPQPASQRSSRAAAGPELGCVTLPPPPPGLHRAGRALRPATLGPAPLGRGPTRIVVRLLAEGFPPSRRRAPCGLVRLAHPRRPLLRVRPARRAFARRRTPAVTRARASARLISHFRRADSGRRNLVVARQQ